MVEIKSKYDVIVIGSGTAGCYFAHSLAEQGYKVCVIDSTSKDKLGSKLYLFHTDTERFSSYNVPEPQPGDPDYIGMFEYGIIKSAFDKYPKKAEYPFTVALLPPFLKRLRLWAESVGVEFYYDTKFIDFTYNEANKINGAQIECNGETLNISARLVADCSGIISIARRKLKEGTVETFEIGPRDQFYVTLRYVKLKDPEKDKVTLSTGWAYYKSWIAPAPEPDGAIIGIGANLSSEYAEQCFQRFEKVIPLPEHTVERIEKGSTPYHRPPYSLVTDGFVCLGDSACMTKPFSGEGITAGWVGCKIAADIVGLVMKDGAYPTADKLWGINVKYNTTQGADFAYIMATLVNAIECTPEENDYEFKKNIVFSAKALTEMNRKFNADMPLGDILKLVFGVLGGVFSGNISLKTVKKLLRGISYAGKLKKHYKKFPKSQSGYVAWKKKADQLWADTGEMADVVERMESKRK
ncbi:MAG: NAD(P)/FAD-dependent oxidoreductase [Christensenellaceae bacterium]|nr:NAD(P)/FAD-dependent oxidoreductase [Christensenellaceae bacterium]